MRIKLVGLVLAFSSVARLCAADYGVEPSETAVVKAGTRITFTATAEAWPAPTYQWRRDNTPLPGVTGPTLEFGTVTLAHAGTYTAIASNRAGSGLSNSIVLVVNPAEEEILQPVITLHPISQTAAPFTDVTFNAAASGAVTFQWEKNGAPLAGATSSTLTLRSVTSSDDATYAVIATNSAGSVGSYGARLVVRDAALPPSVSVRPTHQIGGALTTVSFTAAFSGTPAPSLQWRKNGVALAGATGDTLTLEALTSNDAATYTVVATNSSGSVVSNPAVLEVSEPPAPEPPSSGPYVASTLVRRLATVGPYSVTADFVVEGSVPRSILIRAIGPTLGSLGLTGFLVDPVLDVYQGGTLLAHNTAWGGGSLLIHTFNQVGAFPIADPASKDAAVLVTLMPGAYRAVVSGANGATGLVLIDIYAAP
jgi:hypothetical protein